MRNLILWATILLLLGGLNYQTMKNEWILRHGGTILLELATQDPEILQHTDTIHLNYLIGQGQAKKDFLATPHLEGVMVVALDAQNVATYVRLHDGGNLAPNERLLKFRLRKGLTFGPATFPIPKGHSPTYIKARYGELKVGKDGSAIFVGLRNSLLELL